MVMDVSNQTYGSDHFATYTNIELLCYTPDINTMLYVNQDSRYLSPLSVEEIGLSEAEWVKSVTTVAISGLATL